MQIVLPQPKLKEMVTGFNKVIPRNGNIPVLHSILFRLDENGAVNAICTNLEETLVCIVADPAEAAFGMQPFLFPFSELKNLASSLNKEDEVRLEPKKSVVRVETSVNGNTVSRDVSTMPANGFPTVPMQIPTVMHRLGDFIDAYRKALTFASVDETRHVLNGVFCHHLQQAVVATDGRHLVSLNLQDYPFDGDLIIPATKVLKNGMLHTGIGGIGVLTVGDVSYLEIDAVTWRYQIRCIEGTYPNYQQVIPPEDTVFKGQVTFHPEDMQLIETEVAKLSADAESGILLYADPVVVALVSSEVPEDGERAFVRLPNSTAEIEGPAVNGVNSQYLMDCLNAGFDTVRFTEEPSPWRCTGTGIDGLHVVQPLRMDNADEILEFAITHINPKPGRNTEVEKKDDTGTSGEKQPTQSTAGHSPDLTLVGYDPIQELVDAVTSAQEAVKGAGSALHGIKGKMKAVEKHFKDRQKEFDSTRKIIESLKQAANF